MLLKLERLHLQIALALDNLHRAVPKDLLYLLMEKTDDNPSVLLFRIFEVPNERTLSLLNHRTIHVVCIGPHDLEDAIEPNFVGEGYELPPAICGGRPLLFPLVLIRGRTCSIKVTTFRSKPEVV